MNMLNRLMFSIAVASSFMVNAAQERNDIPSCSSQLPQELVTQAAHRELVIAVDRTMANALPENAKSELFQQVKRFLQVGDTVKLIQFSSFFRDSYTEIVFQGATDFPLTEDKRQYVRKSELAKFDQCLEKQKAYFFNKLGVSLKQLFVEQEKPTNTELIGTLNDIAKQVITPSSAERKVVLLVSDMLENSDITSFYYHGEVRNIEPQREINAVAKKQMFTDFSGADIYVMGAGVLNGEQQYVSSQKMKNLQSFWQDYFNQSHAHLIELGHPTLLSQMK